MYHLYFPGQLWLPSLDYRISLFKASPPPFTEFLRCVFIFCFSTSSSTLFPFFSPAFITFFFDRIMWAGGSSPSGLCYFLVSAFGAVTLPAHQPAPPPPRRVCSPAQLRCWGGSERAGVSAAKGTATTACQHPACPSCEQNGEDRRHGPSHQEPHWPASC